ncbi:hypothetical protein ACHAW5_011120 [Stephanodiscus triporus]|uniref:AB hydrolase-1 domain-containing protein n=1 Tax=Stephanodiscus triporus TaxID=2934178 RepID=A0ABD3P6J8_9STRA
MSQKLTYSSHLGPILSSLGIDVYCVDLLGWGYTQLDPSVLSYSARAKVEALRGLWEVVGGNGEVVVGGASLGGAAVIEYAADVLRRGNDNDYGGGGDFVRGTVLIDAQGFVDGIGPMSYLPAPIARLGIRVLKSEPLRSSANRMSYYDVKSYATEDALRLKDAKTFNELDDDLIDNIFSALRKDKTHTGIAELAVSQIKLLAFWVKHQFRTNCPIGTTATPLVRVTLEKINLLKEQKKIEDGWRSDNKSPPMTR